jgi:SAM-dependent methyltransferase
MNVLPPGTLLQLMYLEERLERTPPGRFIEVGPGNGEITQMLLNRGWCGRSFDLEATTVAKLEHRFAAQIGQGRFAASHGDFLSRAIEMSPQVDLVISCMVMEHLDETAQSEFMRRAKEVLNPSGKMIGLVPGSPAHWGIEDDIAGHCRRYTQASIGALANANRWRLMHVAGLTYPLSNLLLPLSNAIVRKHEGSKLSMSLLERTKQSGARDVKFKTRFPPLLGLFLNRMAMAPFNALQKAFSKSENALVIYFEASPAPELLHG